MITLEVCCGSYSDAVAAQRGGASRIELNSALSLGGLTPDIGSVLLCREAVTIPVIAMLRPRGGGFCYTNEEYRVMERGAGHLLEAGTDGLAFGFLKEDGSVDMQRTKAIVSLIHSFGREAVFHRAFDCTPDLFEAAAALAEAGVDRILTSGGEQTALLGAERLGMLKEALGERVELLAGSGVRAENVTGLLEASGVRQVHSSCRGYAKDGTARGNGVAFDYAGLPAWDCYETVSEKEVQRLRDRILQYEKGESL